MSLPTCTKCGLRMNPGETYLNVLGGTYHDRCFTCTKCNTYIGTGQFYNINNRPYCGNCHRTHDVPNCAVCGQPLTRGQDFLKYEGQSYHTRCFTCTSCGRGLGDQDFFKTNGGRLCGSCNDRQSASGGNNYSSGGNNYSSGGGNNYSSGGNNYSSGGNNYSSGGSNYGSDARAAPAPSGGDDFDAVAVSASGGDGDAFAGLDELDDIAAPFGDSDDGGAQEYTATITEPVVDDFGGLDGMSFDNVEQTAEIGGDDYNVLDDLDGLDAFEDIGQTAEVGGDDFGGDDLGDDDLQDMLNGLDDITNAVDSTYGLDEGDQADLFDAIGALDDINLED